MRKTLGVRLLASQESLEELIALFGFDKKRELVRYASGITIKGDALATLIMACEFTDTGYRHVIHHRDLIPEDIRIGRDDLDALSGGTKVGEQLSGRAAKVGRKIVQVFQHRRLLVGHLFYTPDLTLWHFIYFDQRDYGAHQNHWQHGPHVHFINHLWPEYSAQAIWEQFTTGNPKMRASVHIRYDDQRPLDT